MADSSKVSSSPGKKMRCAIYTRKSSEEGLEQAFNSLDAQREAGTIPAPPVPEGGEPRCIGGTRRAPTASKFCSLIQVIVSRLAVLSLCA